MVDRSALLGRRFSRRTVLWLAFGLYFGLTAVRLVAGPDLSDGVLLLYALPIALLALEFGPVEEH